MQDRDKIEEEKETKIPGEEMKGRNTREQGKTEQAEEAETTKQEQKQNEGTAEHIIKNQQKNTEKQGKSMEERERQENAADTTKYTEPQPQQG